jgi:N-acetylmuramic acid 6-phosphate etherase
MNEEIKNISTEQRNPNTVNIDELSTEGILTKINDEDRKVPNLIRSCIPEIAKMVDRMTSTIRSGNRIFYIGAGTSGRMGFLDSAECPPTFSVSPQMFQAIIAGGEQAFVRAAEGAEDDASAAEVELRNRKLNKDDFVIGIAASGRTPFVIGALKYAHNIGCSCGCIVCSSNSIIEKLADFPIVIETGPEVITGSTRMKAETAEKLVLNMLSTSTMIKSGKVYGNLMIDVYPSNEKLMHRADNIIQDITGCDESIAKKALVDSGNRVAIAVLMIERNLSTCEAESLLQKANGNLRTALNSDRN